MNITGNSFDKYEKSEMKKNIDDDFAMLAHDLKSPIFSQQNALNMLLNEKFGKLTEEQKEVITLLYNSNNHSATLINNILLSYKFENDTLCLNPESFDFVAEIKEIAGLLKYTTFEKGNRFSFDLPEHCIIFADKIAIKRIIINLIANAVKYSENNSDIVISAGLSKKSVIFTVMNEGKYISSDELALLFQKENKTTGKKPLDSNGLGLYITAELIKMHGWNIIAQSYKDGKNIFGFELKKESCICKQ